MRTLLEFMVPGHFFDEVVGIFLKKIFGDLSHKRHTCTNLLIIVKRILLHGVWFDRNTQ